MKLVASLIVRDELSRYLAPCIDSLLTFVDEVRVLDDFSTDGTYDYLLSRKRVFVLTNGGRTFFENEGAARNALLDWTLLANPTHVLAIDADEFVADGRAVRAAIDMDDEQPVWTIRMEEVWRADENRLYVRRDGGWRPHDAPILWRVPPLRDARWRIQDKALACGREPMAVRALFRSSRQTGTEILHFGWANESQRALRYERYMTHDKGNFHAQRHLESIMWADRRVKMTARAWPAGIDREAVLARTKAK